MLVPLYEKVGKGTGRKRKGSERSQKESEGKEKMKILFRPHKGSLAEAMEHIKEYDDLKAFIDCLVKYHTVNDIRMFDETDINITYCGYDNRIDWETFAVTVNRYGENDFLKDFGHPQAIGFMCMKGSESNES